MSEVFIELQDSYFFQPKTKPPNCFEDKPYQPVMWHLFNRSIDKNNKRFRIEIAKSIPHIGLVVDYGQIC